MIIKLILIVLFSNFFAGEKIDFNPRLLQKEVSSIFKDKNFRKIDLQIGSSKEDVGVNWKFFEFKGEDGKRIFAYIGRVNSCRSDGCSNSSIPGSDLQYEYFDYFILFDTHKRIKVVRVFNYEATHGQEVTIKGWLGQFEGYDGNKPLRIGKEIDVVSGATASVNSLVADVIDKTFLLNNYLD